MPKAEYVSYLLVSWEERKMIELYYLIVNTINSNHYLGSESMINLIFLNHNYYLAIHKNVN